MTARKPKPRKAAVRKRSKPTIEQRVALIEDTLEVAMWSLFPAHMDSITALMARLDALESGAAAFSDHLKAHDRHLAALDLRKQFRDASHDEPVSNAGEAVGQHFRILGEVPPTPIFEWIKNPPAIESPRAPWWRRFLDHMGAA